MKTTWQRLCAAIALSVATASMAATPATLPAADSARVVKNPQIWRVDGGDLRLRFNESYLDLLGVDVKFSAAVRDQQDKEFVILPVLSTGGVRFNAPDGGFDRFIDGALTLRGGFELTLADGSRIDLRNAELRPSASNPVTMELVGADGQAWVYVNHLMYEFTQDHRMFTLRSADMRATAALAKRVGEPALADAYIGELKLAARVMHKSRETTARPKGSTPNFHGTPHPNGGTYAVDVLITNFDMQFMRCRRSNQTTNGCDGLGADDGEVVFAPNATLLNTSNGNTADVPWYQKFTTSPYSYPYAGNDQHPFLIWNAYRILDDQLEQIAASGTKHAFLTINVGQGCDSSFGGHILGRACSDTYGTGNNDNVGDLGPRREILPKPAMWGRCNSIFDTNCDGTGNGVATCSGANPAGPGCYNQRMVLRESQLQMPGAQYFTEAWYIVQDDVNIYNTMGRRTMAPAPGGGGWVPGTQSAIVLGPVINGWVDPVANPTRNVELVTDSGRARVAVKVKTLATCPAESGLTGTCYRYDYAVHNFDFATSATVGTQPNLQVEAATGFEKFVINLPPGTSKFIPADVHFADSDINPGNNWQVNPSDLSIEWMSPETNTLDWGKLYRFSFITNSAPAPDLTTVQLRQFYAPGGAIIDHTISIVGPAGVSNGIMKDGFEAVL